MPILEVFKSIYGRVIVEEGPCLSSGASAGDPQVVHRLILPESRAFIIV